MKKQIVFFLILSLFLFSCIGFAKPFTKEDCTLGGLSFHMTPEQVISIYGEPTAKKGEFGIGKTGYFKYGDTIYIKFINSEVMAILSTGNNGWKIPSGITVGSRLKDVIDLYGEVSPGKGNHGIGYTWYSESKLERYGLEVNIEYIDNVKINAPNSKIVSLQVFTGGATSIERDEEF